MTRSQKPTITGGPPRRRIFDTYPIAVQVILVNERREVLLLSSPRRNGPGEWQTVSGGLDAGETVLAGAVREMHEEAGPDVVARPLAVVHAQTFNYDAEIQRMVGIYYLFAYESGSVQPGDDMADAEVRWWSLDDLRAADITFHPSTHMWLLETAVDLYNQLSTQPSRPLQPDYWQD